MVWTLPVTLNQFARFVLPKPASGEFLAPSERRTLASVAEALIEGAPIDIAPEQIAANVEGFLVAGGSRRAWRIRVLLTLIEWLPFVTEGERFGQLSREQRRDLIEERYVDGRRLWRICAKVRYLVYMGAYGDPAAAGPTGFVPVLERARFRREAVSLKRKTATAASSQAAPERAQPVPDDALRGDEGVPGDGLPLAVAGGR